MMDIRQKTRLALSCNRPLKGRLQVAMRAMATLSIAVLLAATLSLTTGCGRGLTFRSYDIEDQAPQPPEIMAGDEADTGFPDSETAQFPEGAETRPGNPEAWGPGAQMSVGRSFDPIYFDAGSSELDYSARNRLKDYAGWLKTHPDVWVTLAGYAAGEGTEEFSLNLSMARTLIVEDFLVGQGLSQVRLFTISYGDMTAKTFAEEAVETQPDQIEPTTPAEASEASERLNELERRVEILAFIAPISVSAPQSVLVAPGDAPESQDEPGHAEPTDIP